MTAERAAKQIGASAPAAFSRPGILLRAIRAGLLAAEQADEIKASLEKYRFKMAFDSFSDLVRES